MLGASYLSFFALPEVEMSDVLWPAWNCPVHGELLLDEESTLKCSEGDQFRRIGHIPRFVSGHHYSEAF